jgi:thiol-disulfide isomerase/thioredoxin
MKRCGLLIVVFLLAATSIGAQGAEAPTFPDLQLRTLTMDRTIALSSLRGKPVLLTFWASWCGPCRVELPELQHLHEELGPKGFELVSVNMDHYSAQAQRFLAAMKLDIPTYRIHPAMMRELGITAVPTNILLDADGTVNWLAEGYSPEVAPEIRRRVMAMLGIEEDAETSTESGV